MKLSCVLLLALVAVVAADSYSHYQNSDLQEEEPQSSYFSNRRGREGVLGNLRRLFGLGATRRQLTGPTGTGTGFTGAGTGGQFVGQPAGFAAAPATTGGGFPFLPVLLGLAALATLAALIGGTAFVFSRLNNSGRGLETDEWEVDHSVWMNQLQKDFEDSWEEK